MDDGQKVYNFVLEDGSHQLSATANYSPLRKWLEENEPEELEAEAE
jgi:hypothetical protein